MPNITPVDTERLLRPITSERERLERSISKSLPFELWVTGILMLMLLGVHVFWPADKLDAPIVAPAVESQQTVPDLETTTQASHEVCRQILPETMLEAAIEPQEERTYLVTFKTKKNSNWTDFGATRETKEVDEATYNKHKIGQEVSRKPVAFSFRDYYAVTVVEKQIKRKFFWIDRMEKRLQVGEREFQAVLAELQSCGRAPKLPVAAGKIHSYTVEKPLAETEGSNSRGDK